MESVMEHYGIAPHKPWSALTEAQQRIILYGTGTEAVPVYYEGPSGVWAGARKYEGVIPTLQRRYDESSSDFVREKIEEVMSQTPCSTCQGTRLSDIARAVTVLELPIHEIASWPVVKLQAWVAELLAGKRLTPKAYAIAERALKEIDNRLTFLVNVGLDYLSLNRMAATLSGGEAQRIRLATQMGAQLTGVFTCWMSRDRPAPARHSAAHRHAQEMRDLGNTVLVVEHDDETIRAADWIVDLGPGAGEHGGRCRRRPLDALVHPRRTRGLPLRAQMRAVPAQRRQGNGKALWCAARGSTTSRTSTCVFRLDCLRA